MRTAEPPLGFDVPKLALRPHGLPGVLATIDGIDGSGKSTSAETIARLAGEHGATARVVKLPSAEIRRLSYFRAFANDSRAVVDGRVDATALFTVLLGDRLRTVRDEIVPALRQGHWVICDRYVYMTFAQMATIGSHGDDIAALESVANLFPQPDLPCVTWLPARTAIWRIRQRPSERDSTADESTYQAYTDALRQVAEVNGLNVLATDDGEDSAGQLRGLVGGLLLRSRMVTPRPPLQRLSEGQS